MSNVTITIPTKTIEITTNNQRRATLQTQKVISIAQSNHSKLDNLDYEHSGHTGFASEKQLNLLAENSIQKNLSILLSADLKNGNSNEIYIWDSENEIGKKTTVNDLLDKKIHTIYSDKNKNSKATEYIINVTEE